MLRTPHRQREAKLTQRLLRDDHKGHHLGSTRLEGVCQTLMLLRSPIVVNQLMELRRRRQRQREQQTRKQRAANDATWPACGSMQASAKCESGRFPQIRQIHSGQPG